jgi:hypothetical protein
VDHAYEVTHAAAEVAKGHPGVDKDLTLKDALDLACRLIVENRQDVTIKDEAGREISGEDLAACCRGGKRLTDDLRAMPWDRDDRK